MTLGKLYDQVDKNWDIKLLDAMELDISRYIAAGTLSAFEAKGLQDDIDKQRKRCQMLLLRTGQLISDMAYAKRVCKACPHCLETTKGMKACVAHRPIWRKATLAIKYAAEENLGRRAASGQPPRVETTHSGELNKWEEWYFRDKRDKVWPGRTPELLAKNKEMFERLDYRGWLNMMRYEEEIPESEFQAELVRLRLPEAPSSSGKPKRDRVVV